MNMIVAYCKNRGIGIGNALPWHIKNELKYFKDLTTANENDCVIMGKNTWLSLPKKPLPNRTNIILSNSLKQENLSRNTLVFGDKDELINFVTKKKYTPWIIGGEQVYKSFINLRKLEKIYVTFVNKEYNCDTFFPKIPQNFKCIGKTEYKKYNNIFYRFEVYDKFRNTR